MHLSTKSSIACFLDYVIDLASIVIFESLTSFENFVLLLVRFLLHALRFYVAIYSLLNDWNLYITLFPFYSVNYVIFT